MGCVVFWFLECGVFMCGVFMCVLGQIEADHGDLPKEQGVKDLLASHG